MEALTRHLIEPIVAHPEAIQLQSIEGEASVIVEAILAADDRAALEDDGARTLRAVRNVLSAAAGRRKATLELVDTFTPEGAAEE